MIISSYRSPKTVVRKSPIHGRGLFAVKPIQNDEIIWIKTGHIADSKTLKRYRDIIKGTEGQISDNFYLVPLTKSEFEKTTIFANHSCTPNNGFLGNIIGIAIKDINSGEELTLDYAMYLSDPKYKMRCNCKSWNCRKIITGKDWMKKDLQNKYGNYFSSYLLQKIKNQ